MESEIVQRARARCATAHAGQKRDGGAEYAAHPQAVADILRECGVDETTTLAAAYLHDVLEDTETTEAELTAEFGEEIVGLVRELTNVGPPNRPFDEKQAALLDHARRMSPRAKRVKLADRLHNLREMLPWPEWKQRRYAKASLELIEALRPWPDATQAEEVRDTAARYMPLAKVDGRTHSGS